MATTTLEIEVEQWRAQRWRDAAEAADLPLERWAIAALDEAAVMELTDARAVARRCPSCGRLLPLRQRTGRPRRYCPGRRGVRCRKRAMHLRRLAAT